MLIEPAATTTEQIKCQSSSTATTVARPIMIPFVWAVDADWESRGVLDFDTQKIQIPNSPQIKAP
jgi:hypothetical protein